jgi:hypothetical protein
MAAKNAVAVFDPKWHPINYTIANPKSFFVQPTLLKGDQS